MNNLITFPNQFKADVVEAKENKVSLFDAYNFPIVINPIEMDVSNDVNYKAIIREDTNELISIMNNTYNPVKNEDLLGLVIDEIETFGMEYEIDEHHNYLTNSRMRMHLTFPELVINDGESDIVMSMYLHNSYDGSEGVRMMIGALRLVCINGMVLGSKGFYNSFYKKHTKSFNINDFKCNFEEYREYLPQIKAQIEQMKKTVIDFKSFQDYEKDSFAKKFRKEMSHKVYDFCADKGFDNAWDLYNNATYYISHEMDTKQVMRYQENLNKVMPINLNRVA